MKKKDTYLIAEKKRNRPGWWNGFFWGGIFAGLFYDLMAYLGATINPIHDALILAGIALALLIYNLYRRKR